MGIRLWVAACILAAAGVSAAINPSNLCACDGCVYEEPYSIVGVWFDLFGIEGLMSCHELERRLQSTPWEEHENFVEFVEHVRDTCDCRTASGTMLTGLPPCSKVEAKIAPGTLSRGSLLSSLLPCVQPDGTIVETRQDLEDGRNLQGSPSISFGNDPTVAYRLGNVTIFPLLVTGAQTRAPIVGTVPVPAPTPQPVFVTSPPSPVTPAPVTQAPVTTVTPAPAFQPSPPILPRPPTPAPVMSSTFVPSSEYSEVPSEVPSSIPTMTVAQPTRTPVNLTPRPTLVVSEQFIVQGIRMDLVNVGRLNEGARRAFNEVTAQAYRDYYQPINVVNSGSGRRLTANILSLETMVMITKQKSIPAAQAPEPFPVNELTYTQDLMFTASFDEVANVTAEDIILEPFRSVSWLATYTQALRAAHPAFANLRGTVPQPDVPDPNAPPTPAPAGGGGGGSDNNTGTIMGAVIGVVAFLILVLIAYYYRDTLCRGRRNRVADQDRSEEEDEESGADNKHPFVREPPSKVDSTSVDYLDSQGFSSSTDSGGSFATKSSEDESKNDSPTSTEADVTTTEGDATVTDGEATASTFLDAIEETERFQVVCPLGSLGLVIETSDLGIPVIHQVGDRSPLRGEIEPGDALVAVDGKDVTGLSAEEVTAMLTKRMQPVTWTLVRGLGADVTENSGNLDLDTSTSNVETDSMFDSSTVNSRSSSVLI